MIVAALTSGEVVGIVAAILGTGGLGTLVGVRGANRAIDSKARTDDAQAILLIREAAAGVVADVLGEATRAREAAAAARAAADRAESRVHELEAALTEALAALEHERAATREYRTRFEDLNERFNRLTVYAESRQTITADELAAILINGGPH